MKSGIFKIMHILDTFFISCVHPLRKRELKSIYYDETIQNKCCNNYNKCCIIYNKREIIC